MVPPLYFLFDCPNLALLLTQSEDVLQRLRLGVSTKTQRLGVRPSSRTVVEPVWMPASCRRTSSSLPVPVCWARHFPIRVALNLVNTNVMCIVGSFCQCSPPPECRIQKMDTGGVSAEGEHDVIFRNVTRGYYKGSGTARESSWY